MHRPQPPVAPRHMVYPMRSLFTITEAEERSLCSSRSSAHYTDCDSSISDSDDSTLYGSESDSSYHASSRRDSLTSLVHDATPATSTEDLISDKLNCLSIVRLEGVVAQRRRFGDDTKVLNPIPRRAVAKESPTIIDKCLPPPPIAGPQDLSYWKTLADASQRRCEQLEKDMESQQSSTERLISVYENTVSRLTEKLVATSTSYQTILKERDQLRDQLRSAGRMSGRHVENKPVNPNVVIEKPSPRLDGSILPNNEVLAAECASLHKLNTRLAIQLQNSESSASQISTSQTEELQSRLSDALSSKKNLQEELNHSRRLFTNSQRRINYLMEATYHHLEADRELSLPPKTPAQTTILPNPAVIQSVRSLNDIIGQSSAKVVGMFDKTPVDAFVGQERARRVLGDKLTGMLERRKSRLLKEENAMLLRVVMDVFLVHWSSSIINGCYPRPKKLYDQLQESSGSMTGSSSSIDSKLAFSEEGIFALIASIRSDTSPVDLNIWLQDIYSDLSLIMSTLGLTVKQKHAQSLVSVLQAIIEKSYELRFALAQREHCGYLETITITSDTEFLSSCMSDIYRSSRSDVDGSTPISSTILGTCSIGLQQCPPVPNQSTTTPTTFYAGKVIMKPGVALRSSLK